MSNVDKGSAKQRLTDRIKAGRILGRLQAVALGDEEATQVELTAMRILLGKVLPDLKQVDSIIKDERKKTKEQINAHLIANGIDPELIWQQSTKH